MTYVLALVAGVIFCLGFAPFDLWPATLIAIAALFILLQRDGVKPIWCAWWFGVGKYGLGASWVYVSIHVYGGAPELLAAFMVVLFVAGLSLLFVAPLGWLYQRLADASKYSLVNVAAFVLAWWVLDWLSTWLLTGFPWLLPGYAGMNNWLLGFAPVIGVLGISLVMLFSTAALVSAFVRRKAALALLALLPWPVGLILENVAWVSSGATHSVALVQGNIDQAVKWNPDQAMPNIRKHLSLSENQWDADVLIWPEAAITLYPQQAQSLLDRLTRQGQATQTDVVLGIPGVEFVDEKNYQFQNLAIALGTGRGRFAKHHLVPFGEYVPLEGVLRGLIEFFDLPMSSSSPGDFVQDSLKLAIGPAAIAICYEVVYPDSMRQRAVDAVVLINISNDTWFGSSIGPLQHMQIAQMRAVENGRWLLRGTNNGVTAIVNPQGEITAALPQFEAGVLRGEFAVMQGRTPFSYLGHWPLLVLISVLMAWLVWRQRHPKSPA